MAGRRRTRAEVEAKWRDRIGRWQRTQCSISEFCRREGVSEPVFYHWRKRLLGNYAKPLAGEKARAAAFIPVHVVPDRSHGTDAGSPRRAVSDQHAWFELSLGRLVCRLSAQVDEPTLRRVVRVLAEEAARC